MDKKTMRAIEIKSKTDKKGRLRFNYNLNKSNKKVRVLILLEEDDFTEVEDDSLWLKSASRNPAFDFLNDPEEDIYTLEDGDSLDDKE